MVSTTAIILAVAFLGVALRMLTAPTYLPWHQGPKWQRVVNILDAMAAESTALQQHCHSFNVSTSYGVTHGYDCGTSDKVVLMFHCAGCTSLVYSNWLVEPLVEQAKYRAIAVDYPCDTGRSRPPNGDTSKCPSTDAQLAAWVDELTKQLRLKRISLVGYSFGSYIASVAALKLGDKIDKIVCVAPAGVVAPMEFSWLWRAGVFGLTRTPGMQEWLFKYMSVDGSNYTIATHQPPLGRELLDATRILGATILPTGLRLGEWSMDELKAVGENHALLVIGAHETVSNPTRAVQRAAQAGWMAKLHPNAGHLLFTEQPANETAAQQIVEFLMMEPDQTTIVS